MRTIFQETQTQRRLIPWLMVAEIWGIAIWKIISNGFSNEHFLFDVIILILLSLVITLLLFFLKLSIKIYETELHYQYFPVHLKFKKISFSMIKSVETQTYNKDRSFHGWGLGILI
jgi:hypothetical protein